MIRLFCIIVTILSIAISTGCGGGTTVFLHDEYNFQFLERVAVIPFDNLTGDQGAGARSTRIFTAQLLAAEAFIVIEPGEVKRVLGEFNTLRTSELSEAQIKELGTKLRVQGLFFGTVTESAVARSGNASMTTVAMVARLVETETGETVWSATAAAGGRGFWGSLLGTGGSSASEATRACVKKILNTLID
jgi:hypothetical protein